MSNTSALPKPFLDRLNSLFDSKTVELILKGYSHQRPTTFRTNTLKITSEDLVAELKKLDLKFQKISWLPDAFELKSDKKTLIATTLYAEGSLYIQSLTSMLPPLILDPLTNEKVLDLTAAPGSKTTQLAALMNNSGKILANDRHLIRLEKLKYNLKKQGVTNTEVKSLQGQEVGKRYPNTFDKTLLDAPCSLEGTFSIHNPKSYQNWSEDLIQALSLRQKDLLYSAYLATKPGGTIVYSTCTLSPEENEEVVDWLLTKTAGKTKLETITLPIPQSVPGFDKSAKNIFDPSLTNTLRVFPSELMEGFYLAKIKKLA